MSTRAGVKPPVRWLDYDRSAVTLKCVVLLVGMTAASRSPIRSKAADRPAGPGWRRSRLVPLRQTHP